MLLDTGSADLFVASTECPTTDESSGCFGLTEQFVIDVSEPLSYLPSNLNRHGSLPAQVLGQHY